MKTEFPILNISPTQWVLVDKTRLIELNEFYFDPSNNLVKKATFPWGNVNWIPVLAAYPKIEGVLLLPSTLWEKNPDALREKHAIDFIRLHCAEEDEKHLSEESLIDLYAHEWSLFSEGFKSGEAAGGYTHEDMLAFQIWINESEWGLFDTTQGTYTNGNAIISGSDLLEKFIQHTALPRALEIEVGEDGSLPSENGTIIYNKAIY